MPSSPEKKAGFGLLRRDDWDARLLGFRERTDKYSGQIIEMYDLSNVFNFMAVDDSTQILD